MGVQLTLSQARLHTVVPGTVSGPPYDMGNLCPPRPETPTRGAFGDARKTGGRAGPFNARWARRQRPLTLIRNFTEVENAEAYPPPPDIMRP